MPDDSCIVLMMTKLTIDSLQNQLVARSNGEGARASFDPSHVQLRFPYSRVQQYLNKPICRNTIKNLKERKLLLKKYINHRSKIKTDWQKDDSILYYNNGDGISLIIIEEGAYDKLLINCHVGCVCVSIYLFIHVSIYVIIYLVSHSLFYCAV